MASAPLRRAGLVLAGLAMGLLLVGLLLWMYLQEAQVGRIETLVTEQLNLPPEALELEEVTTEGRIRFTARDVVLLERGGGDTVAVVPTASLWLDATSIGGDGPIRFTDVILRQPDLRLVQRPDGEWNLFRSLEARVAGQPVAQEEEGQPFLFSDVRIVQADVRVAIPTEPVDTASFAADLQIPTRRMGGRLYQVYEVRGLDARLPELWLGGERGWRASVAGATGRLVEPDFRIRDVRLRIASEGEEAVRFELDRLALGASVFAGAGLIRFADDRTLFDGEIRADPLALADASALLPSLPAEGTAAFTLAVEPLADGRTSLAFRDLAVSALDARVAGRLTMEVGDAGPVVFRDTRLEVESLELSTLEQLGLVEELPLLGSVAGVVSTPETVTAGLEGGLVVDLTARLVPRDQPDAEPSVVTASGGIALGGEEAPFRLDGMRLQLQPLYLSMLRPLVPPEQAERMRGVVRGAVAISGTPRDLRFEDGQLTYAVGTAEPTRLSGLSGRLSLDPALSYELTAQADPIALATLTELFPALPFRTATLFGPIQVSGDAGRVALDAELEGPAGAFAVRGTVALGETPRFDLSGSVTTLTPSALIRGELPVEGAVTGTFALDGTADDLRFDVDLAQTAGRFALRGRLLRGAGAPVFDVAGQVSNFRLGALLGRPGLFPGPLSGPIVLRGGGGQPYQFDVGLQGDDVVLDLEGTFQDGPVPVYRANGRVLGLNLALLPLGQLSLPRTNLNARVAIDARGTTPETFAGTVAIDAEGSTISGIPVDVAMLRAEATGGILEIDTLAIAIRDTRLHAGGMVGLTRAAPGPLRYSFNSPNLATLARALASVRQIPPEVAGSLTAQGTLGGTLRYPQITTTLRGRQLRFNQWRAATLALGAQLRRTEQFGWGGQANFQAESVAMPGGEQLEAVQAELQGTQQRLQVGLFARREAGSEIALSALVESEGMVPHGVELESLALRLEGMDWQLAAPTRVRWGGVDGVAVENLVLQRQGGEPGLIRVDGQLPPTGTADLEVQVRALDLATLRRLSSRVPEMGGVLQMDAVLEGPVAAPELTLNARVDSLRYQDAAADSIAVQGRYAGGAMVLDADVWSGGRQLLDVAATVPMVVALNDLLPTVELRRQDPLSATLTADSLPLSLLTAAVPQLTEGEGAVVARARVRGTIEQPVLEGSAALRDAAVRVVPLGVRFTEINGALALEDEVVRVDSLSLRNGGRARLSGTVRFPGGEPDVYLRATLNDFLAMDVEDVARVQLTGDVALSGQMPSPVLGGEITIEESTFYIPELGEGSTVQISDVEIGQIGADTVSAGGIGPSFLAGVRVEDLTVSVGESVWLQSNDARIQIAGEDLIVTRSGDDLRVFGVLRAERGNYTLRVGPLAREFEISEGQVRFFGTQDINPDLDIVATNEIRTLQAGAATRITVVVNITGTLQFPRIRLTSDTRPPLPESEILSLLIFGRPSFELGGAAASLAQDVLVQEALGGVLFAPLEQLFLRTGVVDYVQFRSVSNETGSIQNRLGSTLGLTTFEAGGELSDNVFWRLECGVTVIFEGTASGCGVGLELELRRDFTASTALEPVRRDWFFRYVTPEDLQYQWTLELRRRWEFGHSDAPDVIGGTPPRPEGEVRQEEAPPIRRQP